MTTSEDVDPYTVGARQPGCFRWMSKPGLCSPGWCQAQGLDLCASMAQTDSWNAKTGVRLDFLNLLGRQSRKKCILTPVLTPVLYHAIFSSLRLFP